MGGRNTRAAAHVGGLRGRAAPAARAGAVNPRKPAWEANATGNAMRNANDEQPEHQYETLLKRMDTGGRDDGPISTQDRIEPTLK